jgi:hypothetical protein
LLPEGYVENYDGVTRHTQPPKERLDLNRNFPMEWRQEVAQRGAGPFPTSEPEVRAVVDFIVSHANIMAGVSFHTFGGLIMRPYSMQPDETMPAEDLWTYQCIGQQGSEMTGYPHISVFHEFLYHPKEVTTGAFDDWMYDHRGVFCWTVELWSPQRQAGIMDYLYIDWFRTHPVEDDLKLLRWNDEQLGGQGYVDWYAFNRSFPDPDPANSMCQPRTIRRCMTSPATVAPSVQGRDIPGRSSSFRHHPLPGKSGYAALPRRDSLAKLVICRQMKH